MNTASTILLLGTFFSGTAVAAGAFGAHALRAKLTAEMLAVFETGVRYQMYHGLALLIVGVLAQRFQASQFLWAGWLLALGTVIFSGSLYALSLTGVRIWGAIAPIGGVLFLAGWVCLGWGILRNQ